jgi:hypothetical protein
VAKDVAANDFSAERVLGITARYANGTCLIVESHEAEQQSEQSLKPLQALWMVGLVRRIARWMGSSTGLCKFFHS